MQLLSRFNPDCSHLQFFQQPQINTVFPLESSEVPNCQHAKTLYVKIVIMTIDGSDSLMPGKRKNHNSSAGKRTRDLLIKLQVLYQLCQTLSK